MVDVFVIYGGICLAFLGRILILDSVGYPVPASIIFLKILGKAVCESLALSSVSTWN